MKQLVEIIEGFFANTGSRNPFSQLEDYFKSSERRGEHTSIPQKHREADEIRPIIENILKSFADKKITFTNDIYDYKFKVPEGPDYTTYFATLRKGTDIVLPAGSHEVTGKGFDDFCDKMTTEIMGIYWRSGFKLKNFKVS